MMSSCLVTAQMSDEQNDTLVEGTVMKVMLSTPSPINMDEVQTAIQYPEAAREEGVEGMVVCKVLVDAEGNYMRHKVMSSPNKSFYEAVSPHLARLRFNPAVKDKVPVAVWTTLRFTFTLSEDFASPRPNRALAIQYWEQAADAQRKAGYFELALELYQRAIDLQRRGVSNSLLKKAAFAAMLASDYGQARVHLTNLLYQTNDEADKVRVRYWRVLNAEQAGKTEMASRDRAAIEDAYARFQAE
jgi:TonB family protein